MRRTFEVNTQSLVPALLKTQSNLLFTGPIVFTRSNIYGNDKTDPASYSVKNYISVGTNSKIEISDIEISDIENSKIENSSEITWDFGLES